MSNNSFTNRDFGLRYGKTKSDSSKKGDYKMEDFTVLSKDLNNSLFIAYMYGGITIGKFDNGKFTCSKGEFIMDSEQLLRMRIFNENSELHIFRTASGLKYRLRIDDIESIEVLTEYIEADQVLFGTITEEPKEGYTKLTEDRGTEIVLPFEFKIGKNANPIERVKIRTRNYIGYIDGHATYVDTRFLEFVLPQTEREVK